MEKALERIESCVVGDPEIGQLGLVARTNNHASRLKKLERVVFTYGASIAGGSAVVGLIYKVAVDWWPRH